MSLIRNRLSHATLQLSLAACVFNAGASAAQEGASYRVEARIYQVLTTVTDTGINEQTLPGPEGWLQVVNQQLDDVSLVMQGDALSWNGAATPENPRIVAVSQPSIVTAAGESASLDIGSDMSLQYMEPAENGDLVMRHYSPDSPEERIGLSLGVTPSPVADAPGLVSLYTDFRYVWVQSREVVEGVNLDVGKPVMGRAAASGRAQARSGEWSCLRVPLAADGWMYIFLKVSPIDDDSVETPAIITLSGAKPAPLAVDSGDKAAEKVSSGFLRNVEVGGSVRIRYEYRTGPKQKR